MKTIKLNFANATGALSRSEMKSILAGSGSGSAGCGYCKGSNFTFLCSIGINSTCVCNAGGYTGCI